MIIIARAYILPLVGHIPQLLGHLPQCAQSNLCHCTAVGRISKNVSSGSRPTQKPAFLGGDSVSALACLKQKVVMLTTTFCFSLLRHKIQWKEHTAIQNLIATQ